MVRTEFEVRTGDGRRLFAEAAGPEDGTAVVWFPGTPGTRRVYEAHVEQGAKRGLRHVSYSRPGYEGSDRRPGRRFADCAADTVAVAEALGVESFHVFGHSGGAGHALACAALLSDRVLSAAVVSGTAPRTAAGIEWLAGMGQENLDEFEALAAGEDELERYIEALAAQMRTVEDAADIDALFADITCRADRECMVGSFLAYALENFERCLSGGIWGWFDDDQAVWGDWGFDPTRIDVPLTIWHGTEDRIIPATHGEWLAANLPAAEFRLLAGEGHSSIYARFYDEVLEALVSSAA